jgi:hypothetical protein
MQYSLDTGLDANSAGRAIRGVRQGIPLSSDEDRLAKLYAAYIRSINEPEKSGMNIFHGTGSGIHDAGDPKAYALSGGALTVFSGVGRTGAPRPTQALHGFSSSAGGVTPIVSRAAPVRTVEIGATSRRDAGTSMQARA